MPLTGHDIGSDISGRLALALARGDDIVGITDDRGNVVWVNDATRRRLGLPADAPLALTTAELFPPSTFTVYFDHIRPALLRGETWRGEVSLRLGSTLVAVDLAVIGGVGPAGEVEWLVCHGREADARTRTDPVGPGLHDQLTGLAGRALLTDRLDRAVRRTVREGGVVAVVFCDVDDLKTVNDELGHRAGDDLLVEVARRLETGVRAVDTVARLGGDEFVVLLDGVTDDTEARRLAQRLRSAIVDRPMRLGATDRAVSASVGFTVAVDGDDAASLIARADAAMYDQKRRHHATGSRRPGRPDLDGDDLAELAVAVTRGEVVAHLEPIAEVRTGRVVGHQALARWHRPDGVVPAATFVPASDGSGLSVAIDLAVLRQAAVTAADLDGALYVHASERLLVDPHLERLVLEAIERGGLPPGRLRIGIRESVLRRGGEVVDDAVRCLTRLGVGIMTSSVDGPSGALGDRVGGPIGTVQLRRQLVERVGADLTADRRVDETIRHAHRRGASVLATGVEHRAQLGRLVELGCDLVEGHLIGPPIAARAAGA